MPHALLGIPTDLSDPAVLAIIGAAAVDEASQRDSQPVPAQIDPQLTLGELAHLRMGEAVVAQIVTPVVGGVHASDPDLVEAEAVAPGLIAALAERGSLAGAAAALRSASGIPGAAVAGLDGGMTTLVSALTRDLIGAGVPILTRMKALSVREVGRRWEVQTQTSRIEASAVVLAVDAPEAAHLLSALPSVSGHLASVSVGDVAVVCAVLQSPELDNDPIGSGVLIVPGANGVRAKAMTHATAKWSWIREAYGPGRHLVRLSYGRNGQIAEDLAQLPNIVRTDLELICGIRVREFDAVNVTRWPRSLVQQSPGHRARVAALRAAVAAHPSLAIVGAGIGGNGLAGTIAQARTAVDQVQDAILRP
jgi:oxygen-dependent protoporphyrinogen oxidase